MKIAFLSYYSGNVYRGVETFVHEIANRLTDLGKTVIVYQNGPKLNLAKYETRKLNSLSALPILDTDLDILFPTNGRLQALLAKIWCLVHNKKLIISGQSGLGIDDRWNLFLFPDVFVALTHFQQNWAKKINPWVNSIAIPNGVDLVKLGQKNKIDLGLSRPIVLVVSALEINKRIELTIRAVAQTKMSLLVLGKGSQQEKLEMMGNKLLPGRFKILTVDHQKIAPYYVSADLLAFPTVPWESFGIVLVEGMAANLPVVTNNDPIRREIVGDAGLFVKPENTQEYAQALETALEKKWANLPRRQAEKFSWDMIAQEYQKLFEKL